ncbi:hypothetical protein SBRCBS47491_005667 [Sporothrix bragantina]|uniref:Uncharacterized protein n=1 Tax=Sporothrix bragantina TaxID=671064 RepID=A0ABP0BZG3_9PEZI
MLVIQGTEQYMNLMERLVQQRPAPFYSQVRWLRLPGYLWRKLKRATGLAPTAEAAVLAEMVTALRSASNVALIQKDWNATVEAVRISAPFVPAWVDAITYDSVINDALLLTVLQPITYESSDPVYLVEPSAVLVDNGLRVCKWRSCVGYGPNMDDDETDDFDGKVVFFISFTNDSIYTSFQSARCYFGSVWDNVLGRIDRRYVLDKMDAFSTQAKFWDFLAGQLFRQVEEYASQNYWNVFKPVSILVAGEESAVATPEFHDVVRAVAEKISESQRKQQDVPQSVGVVIAREPVYAAARGAAFWLGTEQDETYCDEYYESGELRRPYEEVERHAEL